MHKFVPFAALALVAVAVAVAGCKPKPEDQVVGTWSGMGNGTVTINKDKSWSASVPAAGMTAEMKGNWTINGNTLNMKVDTVNGQPVKALIDQIAKLMPKEAPKVAEQLRGFDVQLSEDGKSLTSDKGGPNNSKLTLTKQGG